MLLRSLLPFKRPNRSELWALRNFDLELEQGGVLGIVGRNGAGKTTLLRLLAGVTQPSEGSVTVRGRIAPLISVGVGFHQEMSGRENVYVNGMLLGLTKRQVVERFDEIVEFAELNDFIDTPVKFYSSGMFMRLGFAIAIHTDPKVFIVDEVLAVGDVAFQMKCLEKMQAIRAEGVTIVIVSHSMAAIRLLCPRAIVVSHGSVAFDGDVEDAIGHHHSLLSAENRPDATLGETSEADPAQILDLSLLDASGPVHTVAPGEQVRARLRVRFNRAVDDPGFGFTIISSDGIIAYMKITPPKHAYRSFSAGDEATVEMPFTCSLGGGSYRLTAYVASSDDRERLAEELHGVVFFVELRPWSHGVADLNSAITVDGEVVEERREWGLASGETNSAL